jgi:TRAP-type C4-dicarboxylate transport system substrate-binding protein
VADIVMTSPSYSTGRFPYTEALEQPFTLPPGGMAGSKTMWEYSQKCAMKDYADFKLLARFTGSGIIMSTSSKPILTVDGFKGVKLLVPGVSLWLVHLNA